MFTRGDGRPVLPDFATTAFGSLPSKTDGVPRLVLHERRHAHAAIPGDDGRAVDVFAKAVWDESVV